MEQLLFCAVLYTGRCSNRFNVKNSYAYVISEVQHDILYGMKSLEERQAWSGEIYIEGF